MSGAFSISSILVKLKLRKPSQPLGEPGKRTRPRTDEEIEPYVQVLLAAREAGRTQTVHEEIDSFRNQLAAAIKRVDALELAGMPDAQGALERLKRSQHAGQLMTLLLALRAPTTGEETVAIDREIAAVASIVGDNNVVYKALEQVIKKKPKDLDAIAQLGHYYLTVEKHDWAKKMFSKVLTLAQNAENEYEEAIAWANLGYVHHALNDMNKAEYMYGKALEVDKRLKRTAGMANDYGNLGIIYHAQKRADVAEIMLRDALKMEEKLTGKNARPEAMAITCGTLGLLIYQKNGNLEEAEALLKRALDINERFGRLGGVAASFTNLGLIRLRHKDYAQAKEYFTKALALAKKIGRVKIAEKVQEWLIDLEEKEKNKARKRTTDDGWIALKS